MPDEHEQETPDDEPVDERPPRARSDGELWGRAAASEGAGWVLGLLVWGWVILPFVKGGPAQVKKTLMAKFLNKAPDGSWLP